MEPTFRVMQTTEIDTVVGLMQELFIQDPLPDRLPFDAVGARSALQGLIRDSSYGRLSLICDGETIVGYLVLTFGYSLEFYGRDAFIDELYIRATHRGRGWGTRAMAHAESVARSENIRAIHLEVGRHNTALEFYRRIGYVNHERYLMTKWIDGRD
jgi:ribosomal protein S18 acetylase RimI-like enzyme